MDFMPVTAEEMRQRGLDGVDFVLVTGDAYVDHISFGAALIGRLLEKRGYSVGVIAQPEWNRLDSFGVFGRPKLAFLVTGGNIDPMVNHYSVAKKRRQKDSYSPGGQIGLRPDRATIVYCNKIKQLYPNVPVITGGIEASLRRLAHYDYISDKLRRSILLESGCDIIVYGMGERQICKIAERLKNGEKITDIRDEPGTVFKTNDITDIKNCIELPSYAVVYKNKALYAESFKLQYENTDWITAVPLAEKYEGIYVVQNVPAKPLSERELDEVYSMKLMNAPHRMYSDKGLGVPAIEEVKFSIASSRGCFGSCNFCALTFHQGRTVTSRSHKSIIEEAVRFTNEPDFKGYIHDVGGPTANFRKAACKKQIESGVCNNKRCLFPAPCKNLDSDHSDYIKLLKSLRELPGIKKVFIRSGIRYDYLLSDKKSDFLEQLTKYHVSGQLKIAPEHVSDDVLRMMGKPGRSVYEDFVAKFANMNNRLGMEQYVVPYLMSSHPGSTLKSAIELAEFLHERKMNPEQVQDFYPTPATVSTCMYYTGIDPETGKEVYVPKNPHEKAMQRALIQYRLPQNYELVKEALTKAGRDDLIGFGAKCLIRPRKAQGRQFARQGEKPWQKKAPESDGLGGKKTQGAGQRGEERGIRDNGFKTKKKTIRNVHKKKH